MKGIADTVHERILRPHDEHVYLVAHRKILQLVSLADCDGHILSTIGGSRIAGSYKQFFAQWALCDLPGKRMLASARAQQ